MILERLFSVYECLIFRKDYLSRRAFKFLGMVVQCLIIEVFGALEDRICAFTSALSVAADLRSDLTIYWSANDPACMARFETLFDPSALPAWVTVEMKSVKQDPHVVVKTVEHMKTYIETGLSLPIRSNAQFHPDFEVKWLRPQPEIAVKPQAIKPQAIKPQAIGVYVEKCLDSTLLSAMDAETDDFLVIVPNRATETDLIGRFGSRVTIASVGVSTMTQKGMLQILDNFLALTKCKKILSNGRFGEVARLYHN